MSTPSHRRPVARLLGILGGMGPLASADFVAKLIAATPASSDQDHVPFLLWSVPQIPDRNLALAGQGPSPVPAMLRGLHALRDAGCDLAVIPCNTAHNWYDALAAEAGLPILHMADAACAGIGPGTAGLIGTAGTIASGIYQRRLADRGIDCLVPDAAEVHDLVMPGIYRVKQGDLAGGAAAFARVAQGLARRGAGTIILACSEVPPALAVLPADDLPPTVDATAALAAACVRWWCEGR